LDEEVNTKKGIPAFGFCLRGFSKKKISGIEEKDLSAFFLYLIDERRFLGNTAKRVSKSPTRLDLTHYIIGIKDAELIFGVGLNKGILG
jgi:hypothetical protein